MRDRFASAMVRSDATGWNIPENRTGSPVSTPNGTMSSISKSIPSPTLHGVSQAVVVDLDHRALGAEQFTDERCEAGHRAAELAAEDPHELVELSVAGVLARRIRQPASCPRS